MIAYGAPRRGYVRKDTDPRYGYARWRHVRRIVLDRDRHCYVVNCPEKANIADHIFPVYPGMPDSEFFGLLNLRASCKRHNTARGVADRLQREVDGGVAPAPTRYSVGRSGAVGVGRSLIGASLRDAPLAKTHIQSLSTVVTADYSRREVKRGVG